YELFVGPPEQDSEWSDEGVEGVYRFLNKMWNICLMSCEKDIEPDEEVTRETHKLIKKVKERIENFKLNTVISAFMSYSNFVARETTEGISRNNLEIFIKLLAPFAPHFAEEIWEKAGHKDSIFTVGDWPEADPELIKEETVEIPVQVNGRVRDTLEIQKDSDKDTVLEKAKNIDKIQGYLEGEEIIKEIYVPEKIVNFVVG
ncbi:MAG: class I tRNA ligase family protein, partial [Bacillota bacterium]